MDLGIPPEPKESDIINWARKRGESYGVHDVFPEELSNKAWKGVLKQGTGIASYFWTENNWKEELKKEGIKWQDFVSFCRNNHYTFIGWVKGEKGWEQAVKELIEKLENKL